MENWQSEYLQFFLYIFATVWLVQRGSSESKKPGEEGTESDKEQKVGRHADEDSPAWARAGGWRTAVFSRSLGPADGRAVPAHLGGVVGRRLGRLQQRAARPSRRTR